MKNRRELLKALPFLATIPFVRKTDSRIVDVDLINRWKSYPEHYTVTLPIPIHPFDLSSLLTAVQHDSTVDIITHSDCIEINSVRFRVDTKAKIVTDGGKKFEKLFQSISQNPFVETCVWDSKDGTRGWFAGKDWWSNLVNPKPISSKVLRWEPFRGPTDN